MKFELFDATKLVNGDCDNKADLDAALSIFMNLLICNLSETSIGILKVLLKFFFSEKIMKY